MGAVSTEMSPAWEQALVPIASFTALSVALNILMGKIDPESHRVYKGFSRNKYTGSTVWQLVVLPVCACLMLPEGLPATWDEYISFAFKGRGEFQGVRCYYFFALFATQLKDFIVSFQEMCTNRTFLIHHIIVMATSLYAESLPIGYGNLVISTLALEAGSAFFNVSTILPHSKLAWYGYHIFITLSHVVGFHMFYLMCTYEELSGYTKALYGACGVGVMIGRQLTARSKWKAGFENYAKHICKDD